MPDLTSFTPMSIAQVVASVEPYKYNPMLFQSVMAQNLKYMSNNQVNLVDPTNPFVWLMESSVANTVMALEEAKIALRVMYSSLSQSESDLYTHMSDKDFTNRFASPASATFQLLFNLTKLISVAQPYTTNGSNSVSYNMVTMPRYTNFVVNGTTYSLQYPINIIIHPNTGSVQVEYDSSQLSPLLQLSTNIIQSTIATDATGSKWLSFSIPTLQFALSSTQTPMQASQVFQMSVPFNDRFYYCRVYFQNNTSNGGWNEMVTTYTEEVYDPQVPTASLKVANNILSVFIPPVYIDSGLISGTARVDVYTTKGNMVDNLSNYASTSTAINFYSPDIKNDYNVYTTAMNQIPNAVFSTDIVNGGTNGLTFDQLRAQVISNTVGSIKQPITNVQVAASLNLDGFELVTNVDSITDRVFLAAASLPSPTNPAILTPAGLTLLNLTATAPELLNTGKAKANGNNITILSNSLFQNKNGLLSLLSLAETNSILALPPTSLVTNVNSNVYLYNPYYYVVDNSDHMTVLRAYDLDSPSTGMVNFKYQNNTNELVVNTGSVSITKTASGYSLVVTTTSDANYKNLPDQYQSAQLSYLLADGKTTAYLTPSSVAIDGATSERIFTFNIATTSSTLNHDIDSNDNITFTNWFAINSIQPVKSPLFNIMDLIYTTTSIAVTAIPSTVDTLLNSKVMPANSMAITHEQIPITLGLALKDLWSPIVVNVNPNNYETYPTDMLATYSSDIYNQDPVTGSIFSVVSTPSTIVGQPPVLSVAYNYLHRAGDPVLDANGNPTYLHRAGDVVLNNGVPVLNPNVSNIYTMGVLLVDGLYIIANSAEYSNYRTELKNILTKWVTSSLVTIAGRLLEKTSIYYHPKASSGSVQVYITDKIITSIESAQSFTVTLHVPPTINNDIAIKASMENTIVRLINLALSKTVINITDIETSIKTALSSTVTNIKIEGLGGIANNYGSVTLVDPHKGLALKKVLALQSVTSLVSSTNIANNSLEVIEDITFNFIPY
jgi:hypothetical protein